MFSTFIYQLNLIVPFPSHFLPFSPLSPHLFPFFFSVWEVELLPTSVPTILLSNECAGLGIAW